MHAGDIGPGRSKPVILETVGQLFDTIVSKPAVVREEGSLREAVDAILESGITRKAYVVDGEGRLKGAVTIETLMRHVGYRIGARRPGVISWFRFLQEIGSDRVRDFMAVPTVVVKDTSIQDIVRNVLEKHLNDFPVVDESNRIIGEVSSFNLLKGTRDVFRSSPDSTE